MARYVLHSSIKVLSSLFVILIKKLTSRRGHIVSNIALKH